MNLFEALDILIAGSESLVHPTFQEARETVKLHRQELENPSPIQVVIYTDMFTGQMHANANVPVSILIEETASTPDVHINATVYPGTIAK